MALSSDAGRRWARVCALIVALLALVVVLLAAGDPGSDRIVALTALPLAAAAAAAACLWRSRRFTGRSRWGWATLAAGLLCWGGGQFRFLLNTGPTIEAGPVTPSLTLIAMAVLVPAGLLILPSSSQPLANRIRSVLDGLMIAASLVLVAWVFVSGLITDAQVGLSFYITLLYPLGDIVIATMAAYMLPQQRRRNGCGADLAFFGAGMLAFAISDIGYAYLGLVHDDGVGRLLDLGWLAGYGLIVAGALRPRVPAVKPIDLPGGVRSGAVLLPYLAVLAALASSVLFHISTGHSHPFVAYTRSFLILLIVGRQLLTQLENRDLTRHLEQRVTDRTAELYAREQQFHALVQQSSDVVTVVSPEADVIYQSESVQRIFGYSPRFLTGRRLTQLLDPESAMRLAQALRQVSGRPHAATVLELTVRHRDGRTRQAEMTITNLLDDPHVRGLVLNTRDISERMELQEQLVHEAYHDSLTQLANRALFRDRAAAALSVSDAVTVLYLDLDGFKRVNDSLGHLAGDQLLVQVADRIRSCVRDTDVVARFGADEFGVLLDEDGSEAVARRILSDLEAPIVAGERQIHVRASIGLANASSITDPSDSASDSASGSGSGSGFGERAEQLMRNADLAMHHAKAAGGGVYAGYRPQMRDGLIERLELESDLRGALERGELRLHYQPTVDLATHEVVGFEALVRWPHPTRGMINPLDFIPIAEATGLIVPLGRWVLHEACRQAVEWSRAAGGRPLKMSVNVSVRQFDQPDLAETVAAVLADTGMAADLLCLEMTESVLMTDTEANLEQLVRLKALGLTLAIDDFGTGYSSLAYLRRFPVDTLKIDRSFVERLGVLADDTALTDTIVRLGKSLGMATVAEGIEEFGQLAALREMGCSYAQGYYFSRPVPAAEAGRLFMEGAPV
ncbi:putative diguanylate cyclase/phosphodiesterase with PAS sensor [Actinoplanes missouriensis 431]|uniref:Putative diguanylate cyclase/phosphodiesterase with PAS sensor n=1 Tax=Actinoplanes missouriensis (strain ATCC 14538 / DSM 43046 / CBS 188.64 / JCM 3121 / NBRC 102363 / NCIMB 12654 / NRRL B-3342 / UNCC 431) TaxID=512565 RepID=I0HFR2_ACTM4|nr:EAL domain-containing protein [Actinoplanes missouriensis]BAL91849.1 putative diguanylate cyclase/phosphodiesterase with PAS sensor [Actinoplanes missouriensis 431]